MFQSARRFAVVVLTLLGFLLAPLALKSVAFSSPNHNQSAGSSTRTSQPPRSPVLRLALPGASPSLDPALVADEQSVQVANLLYSGLVKLDASYRIVPDSAASWTVGRDHRTYTFHLRPGLHFSNGDAVTARDFQFSITRSLSPALKSPSAPTYLIDIQGASQVLAGESKKVSGIRVINPLTLQITARWPVPYFLMELTYPTSFVLDARQISRLGPPDNVSWYQNPIGSGPYRLKSWEPNSSMVFVPNKRYRSPHPTLREVDISLTSLASNSTYSYVSHNLDVASLCSGDRSNLPRPDVHQANMLTIYGVYMDMKSKPFRSVAVRRALTRAVDRTHVVTQTMGVAATPFEGYVPMGENGYDPQVRPLSFDPRTARSLLRTGGYVRPKKFPSLTLYYPDDPCAPSLGALARAITRAWHQNLGITVDTQPLELNALLARVQLDALPLYLAGFSADYPDPHDWLSLQWKTGSLNNNVAYHDTTFDNLVQAADATWNYSRRMALYNTAQSILVNDAAWIPLYVPHRVVFVRSTVANLVVTGYGLIPNTGNWADVRVLPAAPSRNVRGRTLDTFPLQLTANRPALLSKQQGRFILCSSGCDGR